MVQAESRRNCVDARFIVRLRLLWAACGARRLARPVAKADGIKFFIDVQYI